MAAVVTVEQSDVGLRRTDAEIDEAGAEVFAIVADTGAGLFARFREEWRTAACLTDFANRIDAATAWLAANT